MKIEVYVKQKAFERIVARKGLSYLKLADLLGVNRVYLSNLKNEKLPQFRPSPSLRTKICEVLECQFDDIFKMVTKKPDGRVEHGVGIEVQS